MYNSLSKSNYNVKKIIICHTCYSKQNFVPYPYKNYIWIIKTCPIIIVFSSIAIWNQLVIYYSSWSTDFFRFWQLWFPHSTHSKFSWYLFSSAFYFMDEILSKSVLFIKWKWHADLVKILYSFAPISTADLVNLQYQNKQWYC